MKKRADTTETRVQELEANIERLQSERSALLGTSQDLEAAGGDLSLDHSENRQAKRNGCSRLLAKLRIFVLWLCGKRSVS
jgi:chromosome segregation ATPase